ncbi:hypothetical protein CYMTET_37598, partial [Cymbomonas tetramitiformis]
DGASALNNSQMAEMLKVIMPDARRHDILYFQVMMDVDGDSSASLPELLDQLTHCKNADSQLWQKLAAYMQGNRSTLLSTFKSLDLHGRNTLDFQGIANLLRLLLPDISTGEVRVVLAQLRRWDVTGRGAVSFAEFTHAVAGCQIVKAPPGQAANSIGVDNQTVLKNANFDLLNMGRNSPKLEKEWRGAMREAEGHITAAEEDLQETWEILDSVNAGELTAEQGEVFVRLKRVYNFQENWGMEIEQCDKLLELLRNDIELAPSTQVTRAIGVPAPKKGEHKKGAKRIPGLESEMACFSDALLEAELAMLYFKVGLAQTAPPSQPGSASGAVPEAELAMLGYMAKAVLCQSVGCHNDHPQRGRRWLRDSWRREAPPCPRSRRTEHLGALPRLGIGQRKSASVHTRTSKQARIVPLGESERRSPSPQGKDLEAATKHAEAAFECHVREAGEQGAGRIPAAQKVLRLQALLLSQQEKLPEAVRLYQQLLHFQQASKAAGSASAAETSMQLAALLAALCEDVRLEGDARLQYAVDALKAYKCAKKIYGQAGAKGGNAIVQDIEHRISEVKKAHDMQKRKMDMEKRKAELTKR